MNDLEKYFYQNEGRIVHKWHHYFEIYETHFSRFRNKEIVIVEIGLFQGGSLHMWKDYFGKKAKIYGIDINPDCKRFEEDNVSILIGSQSDREFLRDVKKKIPRIDILIDDGGHFMQQQIITFEELFDHVKPDGIYLCEDTQTSYLLEYGGGHNRRSSFIEHSKKLIDYVHAFHANEKSLRVNEFTKTIHGIHFYDSVVVIEKKIRVPPENSKKGKESLLTFSPPKKVNPIKYKMLYNLNVILRFLGLRGYKWK